MKTALALLLVAATADAEPLRVHELVPTCVAIDEAGDALAPSDRIVAARTLTRVLEQDGLLVVETGCADTYTLRHEQTGDGLVVHVQGPRGARRLHASGVGELASTYRAAVGSMFAANESPPGPAPTLAVPSTNAESDPSARAPGAGGTSWYAALGVSPVDTADTALVFGLGVRYEHAGLMLDVAFEHLGSSAGSRSVRADRIGAVLVHLLHPDAAASLYVGGGLEIGGTSIDGQSATWSGSGLEAVGAIGADIARDQSSVRVFAELALVAPMYQLASASSTTWAPSALVRIGVGR